MGTMNKTDDELPGSRHRHPQSLQCSFSGPGQGPGLRLRLYLAVTGDYEVLLTIDGVCNPILGYGMCV